MRIAEIKTFCTVVEQGGFNQASHILDISQPTISRQISKLEASINGKLLMRTNRGIKCTDLGLHFYHGCKKILQDLENHIIETKNYGERSKNKLTIGHVPLVSETYIDPVLDLLRKNKSDVQVDLIDTTQVELLNLLKTDRIDIAITGDDINPDTLGFKYYKIGTYRPIVIVANDHPTASKEKVSLKEYHDEKFILPNFYQKLSDDDWITSLCTNFGYRPKIRTTVKDISQLYSTIISTGAVSILPSYARNYTHGSIRMIEIVDSVEPNTINAIICNRKPLEAVNAFIKYLQIVAKANGQNTGHNHD